MRAFVGDIVGKCRVIDLWNDDTVSRFGGNAEQKPDRAWCCDAMTLLSNTEALALHKNGVASFFDVEHENRTCTVQLKDGKSGLAVSKSNGHFIGCYDGKVFTFTKEKEISSFDTVQSTEKSQVSCASIFDDQIAYGQIKERTIVYDVTRGEASWTAAPPPFDEYKIQLDDDDRSILFMDKNTIVVGQNDSWVLVYDTRIEGKEAVIRERVFSEFPISALCKLTDTNIAFGDTVGSLTIMDLKMSENDPLKLEGVKGYVGAPAGIVAIEKHPSLPMFSALSADRLIRLYNFEKRSKAPEKTSFAKIASKCFVMLNDAVPDDREASEDDWAELPEDGDGIWDGFVACPQAKKAGK